MNQKSIFLVVIIITLAILGITFVANKPSDQTAVNQINNQTTTAQPNQTKPLTPASNSSSLPGTQTSNIPWTPEIDHLRARLEAIGLPALSQEGTTLHIHQHLDVFIHGQSVPVSAGIGISNSERFISPIHTHDDTGVIHVESPKIQNFNLGQFFDIWGLKFDQACIGDYCAGTNNSLNVYINGTKFTGDPRTISLQAHQEIVIVYGNVSEIPPRIPSSYDFPAGE